MKINTITDAFEFMRGEGSASVALLDCMNAYALSKGELEGLFTKWLWHSEDFEYTNEADLAYSIELGRIEEWLVHADLIYND